MRAGICLAIAAAALAQAPPGGEPAPPSWRFTVRGPMAAWEDGLPVGNGRIGAQVWGKGREIQLTLDRGDVWDLRYQPNESRTFTYARLRELVRSGQAAAIQTEMPADAGPTADSTPVKLPIGRMTIELPPGGRITGAELDLRRAEVRCSFELNGKPGSLRVFAAMRPNAIVASVEGLDAFRPKLAFHPITETDTELVEQLGYEKAQPGADGELAFAIQPIPGSGRTVTMWRESRRPGGWDLLLTITGQHEPDPQSAGRKVLRAAQAAGLGVLAAEHAAWWSRRWARSAVHLPEERLERLWINGIYKLASSSYQGVPMNLQGLWPPDGWRPPWRGDYHLNLNVQESYWPAYSSNQLDLAGPLNDWLCDTLQPAAEALAKRFFGVEGVFASTAYDILGRPLGGHGNWMVVQYWMGGGGWLAQHLWWQYRYSLDEQFLRKRAYPFMKSAMRFYERILEKGDDGRLHIPLSSSPEYFGNDLKAWTADPTGDLAIVRNLARYAIQASEILKTDETQRANWRRILEELAPYPADSRTGLMVQPGVPYASSHRHPMQWFPVWPGEDLSIEGSDGDRHLLERSRRNWIAQGMGSWTGHAFPHSAAVAARLRRGNHAHMLLNLYAEAFTLPNGFHTNRDYKQTGIDPYTGTIYTSEAECAYTAALNEMLLQSWGGRIRVFPAIPDEWRDVSFRDLRAEGAFLVSAERRRGVATRLSILSEKGGTVRVVWPPGPKAPDQQVVDKALTFRPGERKEFTFR
jgi:alpha-L-fucosidase 2